MSKVERLTAELGKLSRDELETIRDWLDEFLEDQLSFTVEFEAQIRQSEEEMKSGIRARVRKG